MPIESRMIIGAWFIVEPAPTNNYNFGRALFYCCLLVFVFSFLSCCYSPVIPNKCSCLGWPVTEVCGGVFLLIVARYSAVV